MLEDTTLFINKKGSVSANLRAFPIACICVQYLIKDYGKVIEFYIIGQYFNCKIEKKIKKFLFFPLPNLSSLP